MAGREVNEKSYHFAGRSSWYGYTEQHKWPLQDFSTVLCYRPGMDIYVYEFLSLLSNAL
jgi:hypothetical protein